ncbi:hypothetical protein FHY55_06330 [Oceanicola sp. D3]|uniref:hypothetical protein n=1 Tax=Oceanicola sp. D3 TaxID=2587163 RepID=UPI00111F11C0|nr:hypothetical protein [Oceanicola sp. D3]QDC08880.1 hypothetical protein FHY55_06330 [Oceanicola sp. D3]
MPFWPRVTAASAPSSLARTLYLGVCREKRLSGIFGRSLWLLAGARFVQLCVRGLSKPAASAAPRLQPALYFQDEPMNYLSRRNLLAIASVAALLFSQPAIADPSEVGEKVGQIWLDALAETAQMVEGTPPAEDIKADFTAMKEAKITELVELGHEIAEMDASSKAQVEAKVSSAYNKASMDPDISAQYKTYFEAQKAYQKSDSEFFNELKAINILTQYAFFDLLKQQAPEEAERLGL